MSFTNNQRIRTVFVRWVTGYMIDELPHGVAPVPHELATTGFLVGECADSITVAQTFDPNRVKHTHAVVIPRVAIIGRDFMVLDYECGSEADTGMTSDGALEEELGD